MNIKSLAGELIGQSGDHMRANPSRAAHLVHAMFNTEKIRPWMSANSLQRLIRIGAELGALASFVGLVATGICGIGGGGGTHWEKPSKDAGIKAWNRQRVPGAGPGGNGAT